MDPLTIGAGPALVKARRGCTLQDGPLIGEWPLISENKEIMPKTKECPTCGETMRLQEIEAVVQVPGNPEPRTRRTREWVCPDCDYFEEAEEEGL
jgi:hypothetical protein